LINDNTIDQPAGRAITALAYGPVSVVGNTLNSEWEGAWSVIDTLVGGVLILNLGGIHRLLGAAAVKSQAAGAQVLADGSVDSLKALAAPQTAAGRYATQVEALLPGGETLVNSNRVRTGPENRSWSAQLVVTADDLGFDGNQSGTYRPDVTFSNLIAVAHSLRVTDSRFRERARYAFMSALTVTGGATLVGGARSMNMTTENQGDHCIVALSQGAIPVEDSMNQVVVDQLCPLDDVDGRLTKRQYVIAALVLAWRASVQPDFEEQEGEEAVNASVGKSIKAMEQMQLGVQSRYRTEALRLTELKGADNPATKEIKSKAAQQKERAEALVVQGEIAEVKPAAPPEDGTLIDGRVADAGGRAVKGQVVELVNARGVSLGVQAKTDATGYYALAIDPELEARLAKSDDVFLRVRDADGKVLSETPQKVRVGDDALLREDLQIRGTAPVFRLDPNAVRTNVFRNDAVVTGGGATGEGGTGSVTDNPSRPRPDEEPRVGLEEVTGVSAALAERLRNAGIRDANDLVARPEAEIKRMLGRNANRIILAARDAIRRARNDD
jgi:hypothetical protein